jgi:hypothetical protein
MAPLAQYQMATVADETALALSAAPASISGDADVLTLGTNGYKTAVKGKNGFVCLVKRSWVAAFDDAEFWNPKLRAQMRVTSDAIGIRVNPQETRSAPT